MITPNYVKYFSNMFASHAAHSVTPATSANFAWVQLFIHHLAA